MKRLVSSFAFIFVFAVPVFTQQTSPTPPIRDEVVKISTNLIQIDVTVTDKNGKTVPGLTRDDFEVFENGEKQPISNFTFMSNLIKEATLGSDQVALSGQNVPPAPKNPLTPGQVRRTIAIVVDDLNQSFESIFYTRLAIKKFINEQMQPYDLVAIIRTGGGVGALQQFTSDKRVLLAAAEKIRWNPFGAAGIDATPTIEQDAQDITERTADDSNALAAMAGGDTSGRIAGRKRPNLTTEKGKDYNDTRNANETQEGIAATNSLNTVSYIIQGMSELPGRKALMYFSDGLRIKSESGKGRADSTYARLQSLVDTANRASVVVYTFDTKGLKSQGVQAIDTNYELTEKNREQKAAERVVQHQGTQDGLAFFSNQTGGKALLNSNGLNFGMERVLEEQSGYYLIAYQPDTESFDPATRKFNKLEVKVKGAGLKASYRSGFFNSPGTELSSPSVKAEQRLAKALTSPFVTNEISVNVNALYADDAVDGGYIRAFVHIDAKNLKFETDPEGWSKSTFDIAAVTFGDNGLPVETKETKHTIKAKGPTYDALMQNGFVYVLIMPARQSGTYQYRVALRDEGTGKIGSASQIVEIPDLTKKKLVISSMAVENVNMATWQNIAQGKVGTAPGQMQVVSTLLYDTVLKQFQAGTVLRYGYEVYNAKLDGSQRPQVETQTKLFQNNRVVAEGNLTKVNADNQQDPTHLRISGNMILKDTLPPGDYALQVMVKDMASKQTSTQLFPFEIVK